MQFNIVSGCLQIKAAVLTSDTSRGKKRQSYTSDKNQDDAVIVLSVGIVLRRVSHVSVVAGGAFCAIRERGRCITRAYWPK